MPKLNRAVLGAVVLTAISPVLVVAPASAATTATGTSVTATDVVATTNGFCRLFPKLCNKVASSVGGTAA